MRYWRRLVMVLILSLPSICAHANYSCDANPAFETLDFSGEVYGQKDFVQLAGPLELRLEPTKYGWQVKVMKGSGGLNLAVVTLPIGVIETNPRFISGWHFRNRENSGPNLGDVNAPQATRNFVFSQAASDPAFNPELIDTQKALNEATAEPRAGDYGAGEINIEDFGLADLETGQKARMVYLKFTGCIGWVRGYLDTALRDTADPGVPDKTVSALTACGLDPKIYKLSDRMTTDRITKGREGGQRPNLELDIDGDGMQDLAAAITELASGAPGIAICLSNPRRLLTAGFDGPSDQHFKPNYFKYVDYWGVYSGPETAGPTAAPTAIGDAILLGIEGASSLLVYLDENLRVSSNWRGD